MIHSKKSYPRICFRGVFIKMCLLFFLNLSRRHFCKLFFTNGKQYLKLNLELSYEIQPLKVFLFFAFYDFF